jgi:hypothetical protein
MTTTDWRTRFDRRVDNCPTEWSVPLTEVVDTADAIRIALDEWEIHDPQLLLGLTRLVLERHDREANK